MKTKIYDVASKYELREEFKDITDEDLAKWVGIVMQKFDYNQFGREKLFDVLETINYDHQNYLNDAVEQMYEFVQQPVEEQDPTKTVEVRYENEGEKSHYRKNLEKLYEDESDDYVRTLVKEIGASSDQLESMSRDELFDFIEELEADCRLTFEDLVNE